MKADRGVTGEQADEVYRRDKVCQAPVRGFATDIRCHGVAVIHHVVLKGMGGSSRADVHDVANYMLLCDRHHRCAHDERRREAEDAGIIVRRATRVG